MLRMNLRDGCVTYDRIGERVQLCPTSQSLPHHGCTFQCTLFVIIWVYVRHINSYNIEEVQSENSYIVHAYLFDKDILIKDVNF